MQPKRHNPDVERDPLKPNADESIEREGSDSDNDAAPFDHVSDHEGDAEDLDEDSDAADDSVEVSRSG